ncbi:hypothetical protein [Pelagicoccus sp. SDUM812002]|uniref:hypothetical protein n=1 Tax=Pelagicoccus sp. SDUM812002 TaxID=3041266 RepID=UPI00280F382B|nr:hypothetical protein [Pelagicoccus sp. SDUM812002]MDQ8187398.1 hypothetical protein [Pelagicoccus sp. SDUM812002]
MGIEKWIPWQLIARKAAKAYGFNDPVKTLERIRKFSRPSETNEPIELLRAGFAFHARGLANTKAIQNNLDWIWPYWIQRQYKPLDEAFIPRAFSFSHINLTHRNWTAVSVPDSEDYAIVDPRGLITPFHDSWSLDFWMVTDTGKWFLPCREDKVVQSLSTGDEIAVTTSFDRDGFNLTTKVHMRREPTTQRVELFIELNCSSREPAKLVAAVRPYNPEGIQFVDTIDIVSNRRTLAVNELHQIIFSEPPSHFSLSNYHEGDVSHCLNEPANENFIACDAGMASAAAVFPIEAGQTRNCHITIPVSSPSDEVPQSALTWENKLAGTTKLSLPNEAEEIQFQQSLQTLAQLSPQDIYPGPYTYRRFWFRDACLIAHALLRTGQEAVCRRALEQFPERQTKNGYFLSQEGEWDSNGQVLWIYDLYEKLTGKQIPDTCFNTVKPAIKWITNKRCDAKGTAHEGLLPAGFSAEHFGPNDFYYWDDFWAVGGLRAAHSMLKRRNMDEPAGIAIDLSNELLKSIEKSLDQIASRSAKGRLPASPYRRMDSGAIGSLVSDYPLQIWPAGEKRVMETAKFLNENCIVDGAFFQDMIHSGLNIYLSLDLAQTFLRAGDPQWEPLAQRCLELATQTGQWPEAINPRTGGGCMGDGQHAWAAAEWLLLALNRIVREEGQQLVIGSGITKEWIQSGKPMSLKDAPTSHGPVSVVIRALDEDEIHVQIDLDSRQASEPIISYKIPGYEKKEGQALYEVTLSKEDSLKLQL